MKNISYLFVAVVLFIITACGTSESKKVDEPMGLSDQSCCATKAVIDAEEALTQWLEFYTEKVKKATIWLSFFVFIYQK